MCTATSDSPLRSREKFKLGLRWESLVFASLCLADMLSTAWLVRSGQAIEANPVMDFYLSRGLVSFFVIKSLLCVAPLFVLQLFHMRRPQFVQNVLRAGIALYVVFYAVGIVRLNSAEFLPQPHRTVAARHKAR